MTAILFFALCATLVLHTHSIDVRSLACRQNPSLSFCGATRQESVVSEDKELIQLPPSAAAHLVPGVFDEANNKEITEQPGSKLYCATYKRHYAYYCMNITEYSMERQKALQFYCPMFAAKCPDSMPTTRAPYVPGDFFRAKQARERNSAEELTPCTRDCHEAHCTRGCVCEHYVEQIQRECNPTAKDLEVFASSCLLWYKQCHDLYILPQTFTHAMQRILIKDGELPASTLARRRVTSRVRQRPTPATPARFNQFTELASTELSSPIGSAPNAPVQIPRTTPSEPRSLISDFFSSLGFSKNPLSQLGLSRQQDAIGAQMNPSAQIRALQNNEAQLRQFAEAGLRQWNNVAA